MATLFFGDTLIDQSKFDYVTDENPIEGSKKAVSSDWAFKHETNQQIHVTQAEKDSWSAAEGNAKSYTDQKIATIPTPDVSGQINVHNTAPAAHNDIRLLIEGLTTRLNTLADSDDTTLDQMSEIVAYIKSNKTLIDAITTSKVNVSDIVDNLTTNVANKPLSAAQGVVLKSLIDSAVTAANNKLGAIFSAGTSAPSDTRLLWIDTTANTGGLKYHNGSAWVVVPVAYS